MKCNKCGGEIKDKDKDIIEISYYKEIHIADGKSVGGESIASKVYHKKCYDEMMGKKYE